MNVVTKSEIEQRKISGLPTEKSLENCVARSIQDLRDNHATVGFAESCTGGLLSSSLVKMPGVSDVFAGSFVTYANYIKVEALGVDSQVIEKFGAVSAECAQQMSEKALLHLKVSYAVAVTGIAGPSGGSEKKPVGTVFVSVSGINAASEKNMNEVSTIVFQHDLSGLKNREDIQMAAVISAHQDLQTYIKENKVN